jgi:hypothetical protein
MVMVEIRLDVQGNEPGEDGRMPHFGAFTRKCELAAVPRAGEKINLTAFGMPLGGRFVDFAKIDSVEHWPSTGSVTVVVRHRGPNRAAFQEIAGAASPEWRAHTVAP